MRFSRAILMLSAFAALYAAPGELKWKYATEGSVLSSPAISSGGTVYFGSFPYLYALTPEGTLKWRYKTGDHIMSSPAIGSDGTVYFGSEDSCFYILTPEGELKWRYQIDNKISSSPAIGLDGAVYFGSWDSCLYALAPEGFLRWRYQTGGYIFSSPAIGVDGSVYFGSDDGYLYALTSEGSLRWRYKTGGVWSSPAIGLDGTVYFGSYDSCLYALTPQGLLKWRYKTGGNVSSSPAIGSDGTVYFGSWDCYLYALTPQGLLKWRYKTGYGIESSPVIGSDGIVYFGSDDWCLYALTPERSLKWRYQIDNCISSSPAIGSDGTVYVGSLDCLLYAIESSSKGLAASPWPKFHHDNRNTGRYSLGVYATTIVAPQKTASVHEMTPTVYFINTNVEPARDFYCHCEIWLADSDTLAFLSPPYHCEYWVSYMLEPGDSVLVKFSPWLSDDSSAYVARFYATDVFSTTQTVNFNGSPIGVAENPQPSSFSVDVSGLHHGIKVSFTLPEGESGVLRVYNVSGRRVAETSVTSSGDAEFNEPLPEGAYFVRLETEKGSVSAKIVLVP